MLQTKIYEVYLVYKTIRVRGGRRQDVCMYMMQYIGSNKGGGTTIVETYIRISCTRRAKLCGVEKSILN